jgi:hypothetical protein
MPGPINARVKLIQAARKLQYDMGKARILARYAELKARKS